MFCDTHGLLANLDKCTVFIVFVVGSKMGYDTRHTERLCICSGQRINDDVEHDTVCHMGSGNGEKKEWIGKVRAKKPRGDLIRKTKTKKPRGQVVKMLIGKRRSRYFCPMVPPILSACPIVSLFIRQLISILY